MEHQLESRTVATAIAGRLRAELSSGRWPPGSPLRQADLASEFGVSRIPVREALATLQAEGLIVLRSNRGAFVARFSPDQLNEIFDLRVLLETDALRYALPAHTARSIRQLEAIQDELEHAELQSDWLEQDRAFHARLYGPSGRARTLEFIERLRMTSETFYRARLTPRSSGTRWQCEHRALLSAVRCGDIAGAVDSLCRHLRGVQALALGTLDEPGACSAC